MAAKHTGNTCTCYKILPCSSDLISEFKFAVDLFNYVLQEYDVHWKIPDPTENCWITKIPDYPYYHVEEVDIYDPSTDRCKREPLRLFTKEMGDITMFQLLLNRNTYKRLRGAMFPDGYWSLKPLLELADTLFREGAFFAQFLVFCAYACHICVYCVMSARCFRTVMDLVRVIVWCLEKFKDRFREAGGWKMFTRIASHMAKNSLVPKAA